jgi:hypothetical protein
MLNKNSVIGLLLLAVLTMSGCASVPMASSMEDAQAKLFKTNPDKANLYIYRNEMMGAAVRMEVDLDGQYIGTNVAQTYIRKEVDPGQHTVVSHAENDDALTFNAQRNKNYFIWQEVKMGVLYARTKLTLVTDEIGRAGVKECKLIAPPGEAATAGLNQ